MALFRGLADAGVSKHDDDINKREEFELLKKFSGFCFSSELNATATLDDLNYEYMLSICRLGNPSAATVSAWLYSNLMNASIASFL